MNLGDDSDLDRLLDQELQRAARQLQGPSPRVSQAAYNAVGASAGHAGRLAIAFAAAALVAGSAVVTAAAATGTGNPTQWGSLVVQMVEGCKDQAAAGTQENVGSCVSDFAQTHGAAERALHSSASAARSNHPSPEASEHPHGKPSPQPSHVPGGPPSSRPPSPRPTGRP